MLPNKSQETNKYMIAFSHQSSFCFCRLYFIKLIQIVHMNLLVKLHCQISKLVNIIVVCLLLHNNGQFRGSIIDDDTTLYMHEHEHGHGVEN